MSPTQLCIHPSGHQFLSPPSHPVHPARANACYTQCIKLFRAWLQWIEHNYSQCQLCTSTCPVLPNRIRISAFRRTGSTTLCRTKGQGVLVHLPSSWATEFTSEVAAGDVSSLGSVGSWWGFPCGKELWWKLLATADCPFESVGPFIPCGRCCILYLQHRCLQRAECLNALSFMLSELESNLYPGGKMDHCEDNTEMKDAALECCQIPQNNHHPFQPVV